eukprot:CAMPEP_0172376202 /NCGR_PEP_ID=MMETSP1060-20121228/65639_1 /TAXON_ID=37318 /ORGANISM="Pseudo-nitzschia pungens, Strain cf. cingulata" /LENGTH=735 /DNA_ID=CAMNT_0013103645 /DNA_START=71 /DNA_END=2278 /DNA_ORIENTATION=-
MSNNPTRSMAQGVARWYFSTLDPYSSNVSNIQSYLRTPLIALTVKTLQTRPFDIQNTKKSGVGGGAGSKTIGVAATPAEVEEEKKNSVDANSSIDWREYLLEDSNKKEKTILQEEFALLSRRTKARMEAFIAGCSLTVPGPEEEPSKSDRKKESTGIEVEQSTLSLQDGLSGFGIPKKMPSSQRTISLTEQMGRTMIGETADPNMVKHPQIAWEDLVVRLELYIRILQRLNNLNEECVIAMESPKLIRTRARYTTNAFVATATYVRNISPVLTRLLHCLTMEMLAVECVSEDITKVIHRIASEYEHRTSFASLAFLSTPEVNADSVLTPLIVKFLRHLQMDWERLVKECELERMLVRAVDPSMRKMFKTVEFQSIGHLLEVCHSYSSKLQSIELPPNLCATAENVGSLCNNTGAVRQALRDLRREIITVNGHVLPPVTSRNELVSMLTQTLNSRTLTAPSPKKKPSPRTRGALPGRLSESTPTIPSLQLDPDLSSDGASSGERQNSKYPLVPNLEKTDVVNDISENESSILSNSECDSSLTMDSPIQKARNVKKISPSTRRRRKGKLHLSAIDTLTRRLLIAGSRTGNGGDAYFFVKDLFGGQDVEVVPTSTVAFRDRMVHPGTIDILVRLASVTIKCHQSFDIYPKSLIGETEPLIQFHTTTTETISLREARANESDSRREDCTPDDRTSVDGDSEEQPSLMVIKEQQTDRTGWRVISIRPAMYEKIETWNTPS